MLHFLYCKLFMSSMLSKKYSIPTFIISNSHDGVSNLCFLSLNDWINWQWKFELFYLFAVVITTLTTKSHASCFRDKVFFLLARYFGNGTTYASNANSLALFLFVAVQSRFTFFSLRLNTPLAPVVTFPSFPTPDGIYVPGVVHFWFVNFVSYLVSSFSPKCCSLEFAVLPWKISFWIF